MSLRRGEQLLALRVTVVGTGQPAAAAAAVGERNQNRGVDFRRGRAAAH